MFDAKAISREVVGKINQHIQHVFMAAFWGGAPKPDTAQMLVEAYESSPIVEEVTTLVRFANGEAEEDFEGEIQETIQGLCELLFVPIGEHYSYTIPDEFWNTPLGQVMAYCQVKLRGDDLITISEAAQLLRGSADNRDLVAVNGYIERGKLKAYIDPQEPNPTKARRVSKQEVEQLKDGA